MKYIKLTQGITQYIELVEYWVYKDVENKKNHIIKNLILVINNLWSIEEILNPSLVPCELVHKLEDSNKTTLEQEETLPKKEKSSSNKKKEELNNR